MTRHPLDPPMFSRPLRVHDVPDEGLDRVVEADLSERAALARFNGLVAVDFLTATFKIARRGREGLSVEGSLEAQVQQSCVVSLDVFPATVRENIDMRFAPERTAPAAPTKRGRAPSRAGPARAAADEPDKSLSDGGENEPDPIIDGAIDLGAIAAEFLALGLDPWPRKPGVTFDERSEGEAGSQPSPFAGLAGKFRRPGDGGGSDAD